MTVEAMIDFLQTCDPHKQVHLSLAVEGECEKCKEAIYETGSEVADSVKEEINRVVVYGG